MVHGQFLSQQGYLCKMASDIKTDKPIFRLGVDILQSVYKFSGVLDSVGVLPLGGVRILVYSLARRYVRRIPNGGDNGSHWHSFLVYFREYYTFTEGPSTSGGGSDHIAFYQ